MPILHVTRHSKVPSFIQCHPSKKATRIPFAKVQTTTGCTMLGLMDVVYASDTATFHVPFTALALTPEACSPKTFPRFQLMYLAAIHDHLQIRKMTIWGTKWWKNGRNGEKMAKMVEKWPKWWENGQNGGKMAKMVEKWPKWQKNGQNGGKLAEMVENWLK